MKTLIVSDLHLTHVFDKKKAAFLQQLILSCDNVVLNGDFWDGYRTTFEAFLASDWNTLFPLLKEKKTIYLYGNHDKKKFSDSRVSLFSVQQKDTYELKLNNMTYHIEHGHTLSPTIDERYSLSHTTLRYMNVVSQKLEQILTFFRSPHNFFLKLNNKKIKKKLQHMRFPHWYVCGHIHCAELDTKNMFANTGFIQFGKASYLIIDSFGPHLHTNRYK